MLNYRTALTADLPTMMKMVEEAKEGFLKEILTSGKRENQTNRGLQKALKKALYMSWKKIEKF